MVATPRKTWSSNHTLLSEIERHINSASHGIEQSWIHRKIFYLRLDEPHFLSEYRDTSDVIFILKWSTET